MPVPGAEGFYLGLAHPFVTPSHFLLLMALGLLAGSFETDRLREFLGVFFGGVAAGLVLFGGCWQLREAMLAAAIVASVQAALAPARFRSVALSVTALGGVLLGTVARDPGDLEVQLTVITGTVVGANLGMLFISVGADLIREQAPWPWAPVAFRIAAAWIAAIALLLLALLLSPTLVAR